MTSLLYLSVVLALAGTRPTFPGSIRLTLRAPAMSLRCTAQPACGGWVTRLARQQTQAGEYRLNISNLAKVV